MKKIFLSIISLVLAFSLATPSVSAQEENVFALEPLGYWKFDESSWVGDCSTADIIDSSGNAHHGIACINGNAPYPVPGKFGNAGHFDGISQYANMGPGFNFTSSFTAALWIALDDYNWCGPTGKSQHIIGTHDLRTPIGNGRGWGIYWDCDGLAWELTNSTGSAIESYGYIHPSPFPENGSWHHAALVYDSTVPSATLYWDGISIYSESGTSNVPSYLFNNNEPLTINGLPYAPSAGAPGKIDDTSVYDRALTPAEIQVIFGNHPPIATNDSYDTEEDISLNISAPGLLENDSDLDGNSLTTMKVSDPENGTLNLNTDGSFTYTPNANFNGTDSFRYTASDGNGGTDTANVTVTVNAVNDSPVAIDDAYSTDEDTPLNVTAPGVLGNESDPDGDPLTALLDARPANGTLALATDGSFTYTPDVNFNGFDSFTYHAGDGTANSNIATVTVKVNPVNDAPVARDDAYSTDEDTPLTVEAPGVLGNDIDPEGDPLTAALIEGPVNGSLSLAADGSFTYTPNANFNGTDSFGYTVSDGNGGTDTANVTVTVNAINDPPVATDNAYSTNEDTPLNVTAPGVLGNDIDPDVDPLTAVLGVGPTKGSLTLAADGSFTYIPNADFNGFDSFTYVANDGNVNSNIATVTITVDAVNDAPVAVGDAYNTDEDTSLTVAAAGVLAGDIDIDGDGLTAILVSDVSNGMLTLNADGSFSYTPDANYTGNDSFTYLANDGTANSNIATVTVTVNPVNDAPVATDDAYDTDEDTPLTVEAPGVLGNDIDPEGDPLTAALSEGPVNGSLSLAADGSFTYTPDVNFNGSDSFTYHAGDGTANSNIATVTITVNPVNDAPVAVGDAYSTDEDTPLTVTAPGVLGNDSDPDGDLLTAALGEGSTNGTLSLGADGSFIYTPDVNFNGSDGFSYTISDNNGGMETANVSVTVNAVNDPPTVSIVAPINGSSFTEGDSISFTGTANDIEDGNLTSSLSWSSNLDGSIGTGSSFFTSNLSVGTHIITAVVSDSDLLEGLDYITITVTPATTTVDALANGEISVAGTVNGNYMSTQYDDGDLESITERESGGKPQNRYSYLDHKWTFSVTPGNSVILYANAWAPLSSDDDVFIFSYSTDDETYVDMFAITATNDENIYQIYEFPNSTSGTVYIRITDTDRMPGNRTPDTIYVDHLHIQTALADGDPPSAPSELTATAISSSQIDLNWADNVNNESGFDVERSLDGLNWQQVGMTRENVIAFSDIGLIGNTTYYYRVRAVNAFGASEYSNTTNATTLESPPTSQFNVEVTLDQSIYSHGDTVQVTSTVTDEAGAVEGATVTIIIDFQNISVTKTDVTDASGTAVMDYKINAHKTGTGPAQVTVIVSKAGYDDAVETTSFEVQ